MREISGTYYHNYSTKKFKIKVASSWAELDPETFARIIQITGYTRADKFLLSVSLLTLLFGPKNYHILTHIGDDLLNELIPLTNFIYEQKPPIENRFPVIRAAGQQLCSPAADLSNMGFGEWCFAHQYFIFYKMYGDFEWAEKLLATIYRPVDPGASAADENYTGDLRQRFNENLIPSRLQLIKKLPDHIKRAAVTWFTIALGEVCQFRPHVFPEAPQRDPDMEQAVEQEPDGRTWMTIFRELLGPKWGTPENLKNTNAMFVLDELEDRHLAFLEAKSQN